MARIGCFVAKQIAVCTRIKPALIGIVPFFTHRQRNRTVRVLLFYALHQIGNLLIRKPRILAALKHKGPKSQPIANAAALHNLLR